MLYGFRFIFKILARDCQADILIFNENAKSVFFNFLAASCSQKHSTRGTLELRRHTVSRLNQAIIRRGWVLGKHSGLSRGISGNCHKLASISEACLRRSQSPGSVEPGLQEQISGAKKTRITCKREVASSEAIFSLPGDSSSSICHHRR
jgi:hypothetical protein